MVSTRVVELVEAPLALKTELTASNLSASERRSRSTELMAFEVANLNNEVRIKFYILFVFMIISGKVSKFLQPRSSINVYGMPQRGAFRANESS